MKNPKKKTHKKKKKRLPSNFLTLAKKILLCFFFYYYYCNLHFNFPHANAYPTPVHYVCSFAVINVMIYLMLWSHVVVHLHLTYA